MDGLKIQGESASVDHEASRKFADEITNIIVDRGYSPHQIFNADETGIWCKKMSNNKIFISKKEKQQQFLRYLKMTCNNTSGDCLQFIRGQIKNPFCSNICFQIVFS